MKGILFKQDMHKAIQLNLKTVTRRLDHLKEINLYPNEWIFKEVLPNGLFWFQHPQRDRMLYENYKDGDSPEHYYLYNDYTKPLYHVGEVVYIKEAWSLRLDGQQTITKSEYEELKKMLDVDIPPIKFPPFPNIKFNSPLFMPEKYARYFIQITDVRPERLQEINPDDCKKEGLTFDGTMIIEPDFLLIDHYAILWDSINPNYPFASNPWVWRIEFKVVPNLGVKR